MKFEDAEKLLGGYATDTLNEAERKALFEAALANQDLFNALADEEALRELLSDARCRRQLLSLLQPRREPVWRRLAAWMGRPSSWAVAGSLATVLLITGLLVEMNRTTRPVSVALLKVEAPAETAQKPAQAAPAKAAPREEKQVAKKRTAAPAHVAGPAPEPAPARDVLLAEKAEAPAPPAAPLPAPTASQELAATSFRAQPQAGRLEMSRMPPTEQEARKDARTLYYGSAGRRGAAAADRAAPPVAALRAKAASPTAPLGLRYSILRRDASGQFSALAPDTVLQPGDAIRLSVEANQSGYVSLLRSGAAGVPQTRVEPSTVYLLPSEGAITLGQQPGQEKLLLVFSREPQAELEEAARTPVVEKVAAENAVYVVDASGPPAARLSVAITLTYR
jgi:hypothetical protein